MEQSFWDARWKEGRIGFHQDEINPHLCRHWPDLGLPREAPVLVPLCGKTLDMLWLRRLGHPVVGIEFIPQAIDAFFAENSIPSSQSSNHGASVRSSTDGGPTLTLISGDFLKLPARAIGPIGGFYDRAALVAIPEHQRKAYGSRIGELLGKGGKGLLISFEYDQTMRGGPPFSVNAEEVKKAMNPHLKSELLQRDLLGPEHQQRFGLPWVAEAVYKLGDHDHF